MRGKIAFVLGAAVGYVLGTRAGRERYEQIKRGAQQVWNTEPVQRGVSFVKDAVDERADDLKVFVARVGADVFSNLAQPKRRPGQGRAEAEGPAGSDESESEATASESEATASKSTAAKSGASASKTGSSGSARSGGGAKRSAASSASRKSASSSATASKSASAKGRSAGSRSGKPKAGS